MSRPSPWSHATWIAVLATALGVSVSCTNHSGPSGDSQSPAEPRADAAVSDDGGVSDAAPSPAATEAATKKPEALAPALKDLAEKLQPGDLSPTDAESAERRKEAYAEELEQVAAQLVAAIDGGDADAVRKLLLTSEELEVAVKPGVRPILAGSLISTNDGLMKQLLARLQGTSLRHAWNPGDIVFQPPRSIYSTAVQALSKGTLDLTTRDGVELIVRLDQIVRLEAGWKVLQVAVP